MRHSRYRFATATTLAAVLAAGLFGATPLWAKDAGKPEFNSVESVVAMQVNGWVGFDTAGNVEEFRIETQLDDSLRAALDGAVRKWKFKPVLVDGVARHATTRMRVTLTAQQVVEGVQIKVDNVVFPSEKGDQNTRVDGQLEPITGGRLKPPSYPLSLMKQNVGGAVLLAIRVGPTGRAAEVLAVQSMLFDVRGSKNELRMGIQLLEQSAIATAKSWTFNVPASSRPRSADDLTVTVPVEYIMQDRGQVPAGKWRTIVRMPKRPIGWLSPAPGSQSVGVADAVAGELIPTSSAIALATDVAGSDLL